MTKINILSYIFSQWIIENHYYDDGPSIMHDLNQRQKIVASAYRNLSEVLCKHNTLLGHPTASSAGSNDTYFNYT